MSGPQALEAEVRRQQIAGDTPTNEMYGECQELLQMFGIPYIIAPMEAEAQCAWLDANGLVNGVVTDDNDVFLFGAERVYRWGAPSFSIVLALCFLLKKAFD
jgi:DNA excision repair protein ERCC-5